MNSRQMSSFRNWLIFFLFSKPKYLPFSPRSLNSDRDSIMPSALKFSLKPVYRSLSRPQSSRLPYLFLQKIWFHPSKQRSLLSEFELWPWQRVSASSIQNTTMTDKTFQNENQQNSGWQISGHLVWIIEEGKRCQIFKNVQFCSTCYLSYCSFFL